LGGGAGLPEREGEWGGEMEGDEGRGKLKGEGEK